MMPSDKHNSEMAEATSLILPLILVASSQDVPFPQPKQLQCMHHGVTFVFLIPSLYPLSFSITVKLKIFGRAASWPHRRFSNYIDCRSVSHTFFA